MTGAVLRRRAVLVAIAAVVLAAATVGFVLAAGGGDDGPPAGSAVKFAPRDTLVWVDVSTDAGREAVARATETLDGFGSWEALRDGLLQRLSGADEPVSSEDVEGWLGDEAALALVDTGQNTAGSLVVVAVEDEDRAREFMDEGGAKRAESEHRGTKIAAYGAVFAAFVDDHLLIGQEQTVRDAIDRAAGDGDDLRADPVYRRAMAAQPEGRVAEAYVSADGLRRLLVPQGGALGTLATLLQTDGLQGVGLTVVPEEGRVRVRARTALKPGTKPARAFTPRLLDAVPESATAYLGSRGIGETLGALVLSAVGGSEGSGTGAVLERLRTELGKQTGGALQRDLLALLDGEVAVVALKERPGTQLALITDVRDATRTGGVLRRLQAPLAKLLTVRGEDAPTWRTSDLGDRVSASTLALPSGAQLSYAIVSGRLVIATGTEAIRTVARAGDGLAGSARLDEMGESRPGEVTSLGLLDFSQLLELGEQTGLNESRAYLAAREDLRKISAVGVRSHGDEGETTAEILLSIP